ncbi:MAG: hypothetical protein K2N90_07485 [Lachnospiraceae bacterium]|nr:hypothetical protein [Lachnospiraceae bacterium]
MLHIKSGTCGADSQGVKDGCEWRLKRQHKNPNDPARFVTKIAVTEEGGKAKIQYYLDLKCMMDFMLFVQTCWMMTLTCFLALLHFRLLKRSLKDSYITEQLLQTLRNMNFTDVEELGFMSVYERQKITNGLHKASGFRAVSAKIPFKLWIFGILYFFSKYIVFFVYAVS